MRLYSPSRLDFESQQICNSISGTPAGSILHFVIRAWIDVDQKAWSDFPKMDTFDETLSLRDMMRKLFKEIQDLKDQTNEIAQDLKNQTNEIASRKNYKWVIS